MRFVLVLGFLAACAHSPPLQRHEQVAGQAAKEAWQQRGMPPMTRKRCDVDSYQVVVTKNQEEYSKYCAMSFIETSAGCLGWGSTANWFMWREFPIVVISPRHYSEPTIVVHELMHAFIQCSEIQRDPWDPGDRQHANPRVWSAAGGTESVQWLADLLSKEKLK